MADKPQPKDKQYRDYEATAQRVAAVTLCMNLLRSPEDTLLTWGNFAQMDYYKKWATNNFNNIVNAVARKTGAAPAQIADKEKRTPEQQRLLEEAAAEQEVKRLDAFFSSTYMEAVRTLEPIQGKYPTPAKTASGDEIDIKDQSASYFFAIHEEISPVKPIPLTAVQKKELTGIYTRLDTFYMKQTNGGEIAPEYPGALLLAFIKQEDPQTAENIAAKLPLLQSISPTTHTMPNNMLMNALQQQDPIGSGAFDMVVAGEKGRRKKITAYTMIEFDPGQTDIKITDTHLTEYERQVSDAIFSLYKEAIKEKVPPIFTTDMIFRAMPGGSDKASPQQKGAITKTIEKFRRLHILVDATDEMRKRKIIGDKETFKLDDFYLVATHGEYKVKNGGHTVDGYKINAIPIVLDYCERTNQILTIPAKYIAVEKVKKGKASGELLPMTANRQAMTGYLLRRIAVMKRDRKNKVQTQSDVILFGTLFLDAGLEGQTKQSAANNRDFIFNVLDYQRAVGNIKDYEKQTKGRSITGVKILF